MFGGRTRGKIGRNERGAALVEMAIAITLLLGLVFGMIDFGLLLRDYLALSQVARECARSAALGGDAAAVKTTWANKLGLDDSQVTMTESTSGSSPDMRVSIELSYPHQMLAANLINMLNPADPGGIGGTITLNTTMVMRDEQ
ncbi:MAG: pilus assembly protein [Armatimonadetes bacterium]|nr:pilus assembly protein [Armatimonadota bacterium]